MALAPAETTAIGSRAMVVKSLDTSPPSPRCAPPAWCSARAGAISASTRISGLHGGRGCIRASVAPGSPAGGYSGAPLGLGPGGPTANSRRTKMTRALFVAPVMLLLALAGPTLAQDPVQVDAKHYKVEFENAKVRVLRVN